VRLKFDYYRRDRRERAYIMEDVTDSLKLLEILQPVVLERQSHGRPADIMEVTATQSVI